MRTVKSLVLVALVAGLLPIATSAIADDCGELVAPAPLEFAEPVYIDPNRAGGEPVIIAAEDGSLSVSAHAGTTHAYKNPDAAPGIGDFAIGYFNQTLNWRSDDGGKTWSYVGLAGLHEGPHSLTSTGFSDPGYSMDGGGNLYNVEIDLANVAVFVSNDDGQSWNVANPEITAGDRPWVTGGDDDGEAFLFVRTPTQLWKTTTGGIAWQPVKLTGLDIYGQIYRHPVEGDWLLGPRDDDASAGFGISRDDGVTWEYVDGPDFSPHGDQIFAPFDVDKADGTVYMAQGGGYTGSEDKEENGVVEFSWYDEAAAEWAAVQRLPIPPGDVLWTWLVAGENGRVALAWYQIDHGDPSSFTVYVAQTLNAKGSTLDCDGDGTAETEVPAQWTFANASGRPIALGAVCLNGTACNADPDFENGDRRLGDFFQMNIDRTGRLVIATGDTMRTSITGGPKPVANPVFIGQTGGDLLLETPEEIRETRCLGELPICG